MKISVRFLKGVAILAIEGRININSSKLIEAVGRLIEKKSVKIIIDMRAVEFIDYNGLSVLAITYKNALNNKSYIKICNVPVHIQELLRVVKLDDVFEIYTDIKQAIASFGHKTAGRKARASEQPVRRRFMRLDIDMPVVYRLSRPLRHKTESGLYSGRIANLSGAGVFIRSIHILPPGSEVILEIILQEKKEPKRFHGVVMWLADEALQPELYPGMGVAFTELSPHAQERVIDYIERRASRP